MQDAQDAYKAWKAQQEPEEEGEEIAQPQLSPYEAWKNQGLDSPEVPIIPQESLEIDSLFDSSVAQKLPEGYRIGDYIPGDKPTLFGQARSGPVDSIAFIEALPSMAMQAGIDIGEGIRNLTWEDNPSGVFRVPTIPEYESEYNIDFGPNYEDTFTEIQNWAPDIIESHSPEFWHRVARTASAMGAEELATLGLGAPAQARRFSTGGWGGAVRTGVGRTNSILGASLALELTMDQIAAEGGDPSDPVNMGKVFAASMLGGAFPELTVGASKFVARGLGDLEEARNLIEVTEQAGRTAAGTDVFHGGAANMGWVYTLWPGSGWLYDRKVEVDQALERSLARTADEMGSAGSVESGRIISESLANRVAGANETFGVNFRDNRDIIRQAFVDTRGNTAVDVSGVIEYIRRNIEPTPGAENITEFATTPMMQDLFEDFMLDAGATGTIPMEAVYRLRTNIGERITASIVSGDVGQGEMRGLYQQLSEVIEGSIDQLYNELSVAARNSPMGSPERARLGTLRDARAQYRRLNREYSQFQDEISAFYDKINKSVRGAGLIGQEDVYTKLLERGNLNPQNIQRLRRALNNEEYDAVLGTLISGLGVDNKGNWTIQRFLRDYQRLSRNEETMDELFAPSRHRGLRTQLERLDRAVQRLSERRQANPNIGSQRAGAGSMAVYGMLATALLGSANDVPTSGGAAGGLGAMVAASTSASFLMSQDWFVRWMADSIQLDVPQNARNAAFIMNEQLKKLYLYAENAGNTEAEKLLNQAMANDFAERLATSTGVNPFKPEDGFGDYRYIDVGKTSDIIRGDSPLLPWYAEED